MWEQYLLYFILAQLRKSFNYINHRTILNFLDKILYAIFRIYINRTWCIRIPLGNFGGMNLTAFMGPLSSFSLTILIVVGGLLTRVGNK